MRFITILILLLIPSLSYGMSKDERIKALEENNIPIDYMYYLEKQIRKPMSRLIEPLIGSKKTDLLFNKSNYIIKKRKNDKIMKNGIIDLIKKKHAK